MRNQNTYKGLTEAQTLITVQKPSQPSRLFVQLLVLRFISKLRQRSNNINIHSLSQEHLQYVNDPTLIKSYYTYQGSGLNRLIRQYNQPSNNIISNLMNKFIKFKQHLKNKIQQIGTYHPNVILTMQIIVSLLSIEQFYLIILHITFDYTILWLDYVCISILICDVLVKSITDHYDNLMIILSRSGCISKHINTEQLTDITTLIPSLIYIVYPTQLIDYCRLIFYYRVLNVNRIFQKIEYIMSDLQQYLLQLIKLYVILITTAHIIGCFWFVLGNSQQVNWQSLYFQDNQQQLNDKLTVYITSIYWSLTTMLTVGYGDVLPVSLNEKIYSLLTMLVGCCLFGYVMSSIGGIFDRIDTNGKKLRQEMQKLNRFLDSKCIDEKLKSKFRKYLEHKHLQQRSKTLVGKITNQNVSVELRLEFNAQLLTSLSKQHFLLSRFDQSLLHQLSQVLQECNYLPDELIYENSISFNLYLIQQGVVAEQFQRQNCQPFQYYRKGETFGEVDFVANQRLQCYFISQTFTSTFILQRDEFYQIVREHSWLDFQKLCNITDLVQHSRDLRGLNRSCQICYKSDHLLYTCLQIHYYPNIQRMVSNKQFQQRSPFLRGRMKDQYCMHKLATIQSEAIVFLEDYESKIDIQSDSNQIYSSEVNVKSVPEVAQMKREESQISQAGRQHSFQLSVIEVENYKDKVSSNLNYEQLIRFRVERDKKRAASKFIMSQGHITKFNNQYIIDFDRRADFEYYFPQFNLTNLI